MELMSPLLFCYAALAVFLPQALGNAIAKPSQLELDDCVSVKSKSVVANDMIIDITPYEYFMNKVSDFQSAFVEPNCKNYYTFLKQAIKDDNNIIPNFSTSPITQENNRRNKRKTDDSPSFENKPKKIKVKRNNSFSITKYEKNDKTFALKVKETNAHSDNQSLIKTLPTCQVYSVQKYFPCETPEADLILTAPKRKINKKSRKERNKRQKNLPDAKTTVIAPLFTTRQIDSSQVPEHIMPSIEELY